MTNIYHPGGSGKLPKLKQQSQVEIATTQGKMLVQGEKVSEHFAIADLGVEWSLTHLPSGAALGLIDSQERPFEESPDRLRELAADLEVLADWGQVTLENVLEVLTAEQLVNIRAVLRRK